MMPAENNMKICDIHTHVLPGMDDGAQNLSEALQMLENAVASDVEYLIVTPHCNRTEGAEQIDLQDAFVRLRHASVGIPLKLALGAEVHVTDCLPALLKARRFPTLNGSRYLLTEFPFFWEAEAFLPMLEQIRMLGYVPVVAHPERYDAVIRDPAQIFSWLELGCHIQLTGASVVGKYGNRVQRASEFLLKNGLVCCVASDAHGAQSRSNNLLEVQSYLTLYHSRQCAKALLWDNPMKIWRDADF